MIQLWVDLSHISVNKGIKSRHGWTKYSDLYEIVHPSLNLIFFMFGYWCGRWERSVRQESYDFCVSPSLLSFSHFALEVVGKIFGLFLSQKPGWNFSSELKAKLVLAGNRAHMKTPSNIFELNIDHHYQCQIKGWPNKTINKTYWERLFNLTVMLLYFTPRNVTGTSLIILSKHV